MVRKILAILTSPFAVAVGAILMLSAGSAVGIVIYGKMQAAEAKRKADLKAAEEAAKRGPPKPERVRAPEEGPNPFEPRYVSLGDEILSNLPQRGRAVLIELGLVTLKGENAQALLDANRIPLRSLAVAHISDLTVQSATAPDAQEALANRLRKAMNDAMRQKAGVEPVDQVFIKRYYVQ